MSDTQNRKLDLEGLCKSHGVRVVPFRSAASFMEKAGLDPSKASGYAFFINNTPAILFDDGLSNKEIRYTIAHELGHILLGHLSYREKNEKITQGEEMEANIFASVLFAFDLLAEYEVPAKEM